jgi:hypothetical protein
MAQATNIPRPQIPDGDYAMVSQTEGNHIQLSYRVGDRFWFVLMSYPEAVKHADDIKAIVRLAKKKGKVK